MLFGPVNGRLSKKGGGLIEAPRSSAEARR